MKEGPDIAGVAALIGDPARANMLTALMSGKALTATELSHEAGVTAQTASSHLAKLDRAGLITRQKQGRHRYFTLATDDVARVLEALMGIAAGSGHLRTRTGPKDAALRKARVCYNHLAGDMGTQMFDSLTSQACLTVAADGIALTEKGAALVSSLQI
ncbi:MAG: winged helix-turn-helix domain-containing protein, partial [Pseudomonadota bacterium]